VQQDSAGSKAAARDAAGLGAAAPQSSWSPVAWLALAATALLLGLAWLARLRQFRRARRAAARIR
jgi:protein-S-isoprenylcysteine O-methyltransferase Ste14